MYFLILLLFLIDCITIYLIIKEDKYYSLLDKTVKISLVVFLPLIGVLVEVYFFDKYHNNNY